MYTGYYYNPNKDMGFVGDVNYVYIGDKFISPITEVRTSDHVRDLAPRVEDGEELILITSDVSEIFITNFNPDPETPFDR